MSRNFDSWILAPSFDIPADGPVTLGSIITGPGGIHRPLNRGHQIPAKDVHISHQENFEQRMFEAKHATSGVWGRFLQSLGIGGDVSKFSSTENWYKFPELESRYFIPKPEYLQKSLEDPWVSQFLRATNYKKKLYMIIGIRIAKSGGTRGVDKSESRAAHMSIVVPTNTVIPSSLDLEPRLSVTHSTSTSLFEPAADFVYAVRLRKLAVKRPSKTGQGDRAKGLQQISQTSTSANEDDRHNTLEVDMPNHDLGSKDLGISGMGTVTQDEMVNDEGSSGSPSDGPYVECVPWSDIIRRDSIFSDTSTVSFFSEESERTHDSSPATSLMSISDSEGDDDAKPRTKPTTRSATLSSKLVSPTAEIDTTLVQSPSSLPASDESRMDVDQVGSQFRAPGSHDSLNSRGTQTKSCLSSQVSNTAYYYGIRGGLGLLASTISEKAWPRNPVDRTYTSKKHFFPVGNHPITSKWESEILPQVLPFNKGNWLSIHCLRIGFESETGENPVILILVNLSSLQSTEAIEISRSVKAICQKSKLEDVEVEIAEMPTMQKRTVGKGDEAYILSSPVDNKVYIGASIGPSASSSSLGASRLSTGTFAAYLSAKENKRAGKPILLALTNDHVCFDEDEKDGKGNIIKAARPCLEPNLINRAFKSESAKNIHYMTTPAAPDYEATEESLVDDHMSALAKYERQRSLPTQGPNHPTAINAKEKIFEAASALSQFRGAKKTLGTVYGTGGSRVDPGSGMPMDWGVMKAPDNDIAQSCRSELNELPPRDFRDPKVTARAIKKYTIQHLKINESLVEDLDETLPSQISKMRSNPPETNEVFFKVGRTTGWRAGVANSCSSVYFEVYGKKVQTKAGKDEHRYADYGACLMWCFLGINSDLLFSQGGDSGNLVFDRFGKAVGLVFCGTNERRNQTGSYAEVQDVTSVISLDAVLRDIEKELDLSEIKFANA